VGQGWGGITPQLSHLGWPNTPFAGAGAAGGDDVDELRRLNQRIDWLRSPGDINALRSCDTARWSPGDMEAGRTWEPMVLGYFSLAHGFSCLRNRVPREDPRLEPPPGTGQSGRVRLRGLDAPDPTTRLNSGSPALLVILRGRQRERPPSFSQDRSAPPPDGSGMAGRPGFDAGPDRERRVPMTGRETKSRALPRAPRLSGGRW